MWKGLSENTPNSILQLRNRSYTDICITDIFSLIVEICITNSIAFCDQTMLKEVVVQYLQ